MRESIDIQSRARVPLVADINVVPYIDVMLVLLIIFMVTAPMMVKGVRVELPQTHAKNMDKAAKPMVVTVDKQGLYYFNQDINPKQAQSQYRLVHTLRQYMAKQTGHQAGTTVYVKADKQVDYGKVMTLMAVMQQLGVEHIGLVSEAETPAKLHR